MKYIFLICFIMKSIAMFDCIHANTYFKCCHIGEQLTEYMQCVPSSKIHVLKTQEYGKVTKKDEPHWVPESLRIRGYAIRYGVIPCVSESLIMHHITERHVISINSFGSLSLHSNQTNVTDHFNEYCFDFLKGGNKSIVLLGCVMHYSYVDKCCPLGEYITYSNGKAKCENSNRRLTSVLVSNKTYHLLYRDLSKFVCDNTSWKIFEDKNEEEKNSFISSVTRRVTISHLMYDTYVCIDSGWVNGNFQKYTKMYCRRPQLLRGLYVLSQMLTLISIVCLVLVLLAMCTLPELRSSSPGKALCCHISCLLMVYTIRAVWFFNFLKLDSPALNSTETSCLNYALAIYFFLTASCFWLNVISIDTADRFRRSSMGGAPPSGRLRFVIFALYAWGGAIALTARCSIMAFGVSDSQRPTFQETRTCYYESQFLHLGGRRKTLEYYYGPMSVLFLINIALYAYIAIKLYRMYEATAQVENQYTSLPPHRSAVVLVRLILLLGGVEWAAEMTGWGTRRQPRPGRQTLGRLAHPDDALASEHALRLALNLLDTLRAACLLWVCCGRPRVRRQLAEGLRRAAGAAGRWRAGGGRKSSNNREVCERQGSEPKQITTFETPLSNGRDQASTFVSNALRICHLPIALKSKTSPKTTVGQNTKATIQDIEMPTICNYNS